MGNSILGSRSISLPNDLSTARARLNLGRSRAARISPTPVVARTLRNAVRSTPR
jgi:hypothetical protein